MATETKFFEFDSMPGVKFTATLGGVDNEGVELPPNAITLVGATLITDPDTSEMKAVEMLRASMTVG